MSDDNNVTEIQSEAFQPDASEAADNRASDRSTVWYVLGTGDMRILRSVLLDQDQATLTQWRQEAQSLISEIEGANRWHSKPE